MKTPRIPQTDSIKELATFWETHDFTDFEDQMERVVEPVFKRESRESYVKVPLKPKEAKIVHSLAKRKGVKDSDLIHEWVVERIQTA